MGRRLPTTPNSHPPPSNMFRVFALLTVIVAVVSAANVCKPCTCGVARGARVVGGEPLAPGEFPWLAALMLDKKYQCGATIIAKDYLITAAHCVNGIDITRFSVLIGEYDVNNSVTDGYEVEHITEHQDFNRYSYDNDIAVLRLAESMDDRLFRPACLPDVEDALSEGTDLTVSGWGATVEKGTESNIPRKVNVRILGDQECYVTSYGKKKVTPRMICASSPGRDACGGDSGGPLLSTQPYSTIVGIVSWGRGCARPGYPGIYTRVSRFLPWLQGALRHACTCEPPSFY